VPLKLSRRRLGALLAAAAATAALAWYLWTGRGLAPAEMLAHLPSADSPLLFIDVGALRQAGILDLIAGSKAAEESEYTAFVARSGFDYRRDLDAVMASFQGGQTFLIARGRFDWRRLEAYAREQGGSCERSFCRLPAATPGRRLSFFALRRDTLAFASSPNEWAAEQMRGASKAGPRFALPSDPAWLAIPGATLRMSDAYPAGTRLFAKALENAERVILAAGRDGGRMRLRMDATTRSEEDAVILRAQLEKVTEVMTKFIARLDQKPNPSDLSGVLTGGTFRREGLRVVGTWPVPREFLEALSKGDS